MIVLCVTNCPAGLRGDLSKWLSEVNTGVYVGRLSARVRKELWDRVCCNIKSGQATMVYSTNNEQSYTFLTHNTTWSPIDYEGIVLMRRPLSLDETKEQTSFLQAGFSKAAKYEKARTFRDNKMIQEYVIMDIKTTGEDYKHDRIIEIGILRIEKNDVKQRYQCLIQSGKDIPDNVEKRTGITKEMIEEQGIQEEEALEKAMGFIGEDLIVGYDLQSDVKFIQELSKRVGKSSMIKKAKDVRNIARRKLDDLDDHRLETVASYFSFDMSGMRRALTDCMLIYRIYLELNKL